MNKYYIQSALNIDSNNQKEQEIKPLINTKDSFKKIVIVKDNILSKYDENDIFYIGIEQFLLDEKILN